MLRTQVYLTERQHEKLSQIAKTRGKKQSELIREAVDNLIDQVSPDIQKAILSEAAGMWKDRSDIPDVHRIRTEWDREQS